MLSIHYFASIREQVGINKESVDFDTSVSTVSELINLLGARHSGFGQASETPTKLLVSVNQVVVDKSHKLHDGDEIAFFPPMTGG